MTEPASIGSCARRWDALLAENSILHKEHIDLLSAFTPPFSACQIAQLEASAARRVELPEKIQRLVEEWTRSVSI
jgi:aspartate carbamoyltransferase regulatory subunit